MKKTIFPSASSFPSWKASMPKKQCKQAKCLHHWQQESIAVWLPKLFLEGSLAHHLIYSAANPHSSHYIHTISPFQGGTYYTCKHCRAANYQAWAFQFRRMKGDEYFFSIVPPCITVLETTMLWFHIWISQPSFIYMSQFFSFEVKRIVLGL